MAAAQLIVGVAEDSTSSGSCPWGSSRKRRAPALVEVDQASHMKAQSFRRVGSVLAWAAAVLQTLGGRRPCRCSRGRPCQKAQSHLVAGVGFPDVVLAHGVVGTEPVAEDPCSPETAACTSASAADNTCSVVSGTADSTLPTVGSVEHSSCSPGCQKAACLPG